MWTTTTTSKSKEPNAGFDTVDRLAAFYLTLPVAIFCLGWLEPLVALGTFVALLLLLWPLNRSSQHAHATTWPWLAVAIAVAMAWAAFGGAGHFFYANQFDWKVRDAVLRDLTVLPWPVNYGQSQEFDFLLRAPIAYYLPVALLARWIGLMNADLCLYGWTVAGLFLFIWLMFSRTRIAGLRLLWLGLLPWFSGADALGWWLFKPHAFDLGQHLEWWVGAYQYSASSTLLFWVPNHALPGWLAAGLLLRHWSRPSALWVLTFLFAVTPLWSPLVTISLLPFAMIWLVQNIRWFVTKSWLTHGDSWTAMLGGLWVAGICSIWLVADTQAIPLGSTFVPIAWEAWLIRWVTFQVLEWGAIAVLAYRRDIGAFFWAAVVLLLVLPVFKFGVGNDLAMRASILPLMILFTLMVEALWGLASNGHLVRAGVVCVVLMVGAITPAQEFIRAWRQPRWGPDLRMNVLEATGYFPANYIARWQKMPDVVRATFRPPDASSPNQIPATMDRRVPKN